jgi:hypothetical protein
VIVIHNTSCNGSQAPRQLIAVGVKEGYRHRLNYNLHARVDMTHHPLCWYVWSIYCCQLCSEFIATEIVTDSLLYCQYTVEPETFGRNLFSVLRYYSKQQ